MLSIAFLANYFSLMLPKMHKSLQVAESLSNAPRRSEAVFLVMCNPSMNELWAA